MLRLAVCVAACCAFAAGTGPAAAQEHSGWSAYGRLTLDIGTDRYYVYEQAAHEFSASVVDRKSAAVRIRAVSIPGAGLFYFPAGASPCQPDALERLGLYAELVLYYLAAAFPGGPHVVQGAASAVVDGPIPELHFMQGVMKAREGARTVISLSPQPGAQFDYAFKDDKDDVKGTWDARRPDAVIPDDEPLERWHTCWGGTWQPQKGRAPAFKPYLEGARALKTFGEVRRAVREAHR